MISLVFYPKQLFRWIKGEKRKGNLKEEGKEGVGLHLYFSSFQRKKEKKGGVNTRKKG